MGVVTNVLIYGNSESTPALRHEIPVSIPDPFLYLEAGERRAVLTSALDEARIREAAPGVELLLADALGWSELCATGRPREELELELCLRAVRALAIEQARVPGEFPLGLADHLRHAGVDVQADASVFAKRRRHKSAAEMSGIRRAADAAVLAIGEVARMLADATIDAQQLRSPGGELLTAEDVQRRIRETCATSGAFAPADVVVRAAGPGSGIGHDLGQGPLPAHQPIEVDLWPRDEASGCWADMARTFVRGDISDDIARLHELALDAHTRACANVRPGVSGDRLHGIACEVFEAAGLPTLRTKTPAQTLREGFYYSLGHGVGLDVHEAPALGPGERDTLLSGDVVAVEPGSFLADVGGVGVEDLLVVTDSGSENLTGRFPHGLVPHAAAR